MVKVGLIGLGEWGGKVLKPKISSICNLDWAVRGRDPSMYLPLLNSVDWVVVATPTPTHNDIVKSALETGKNVFCEKPLTTSPKKASELYELADKRGVQLYVDDVFAWSDQAKEFADYVNNRSGSELEFEWQKFGSFKDNVFSALLYHDLTILDKLTGGVQRFEVGAVERNDPNAKNLVVRVNDHEVHLRYNRLRRDLKSKRIFANGTIVYDSVDQKNDPLQDMFTAVFSGKADYKGNQRRTLMTERILSELIATYERGFTSYEPPKEV
jgi:predicted dehydrogenase